MADILAFMSALDTREIHGYLPEFGYRVFTDTALHSGPSPAQPSHQMAPVPGSGWLATSLSTFTGPHCD